MPIINEDEFKKEIKSGLFSPVYFLYGDDSYLKKHYTDLVVKKICGDDTVFNYQYFDRNCDLQDVFNSVNQLPLMADFRCTVLDDYDYIHADKDDFKRLCELVADVPDGSVLLIRMDDVEFNVKQKAPKPNTPAGKLLLSAEKCGGKAVCLNHRTIGALSAMIVRGAEKRGLKISTSTASYMIEVIGEDINTITNELQKICSFLKSGEITKEIVDKVCSKSVEASVYDFVTEIVKCNISGALKMLDDLFYMHIESINILFTVTAFYVDVFRILTANQSGVPYGNIANDFSYGQKYGLEKAKRYINKFDMSKVKKSLNEIMKTDMKLKSFSGNDRLALEELTVKLGVIISEGGEAID